MGGAREKYGKSDKRKATEWIRKPTQRNGDATQNIAKAWEGFELKGGGRAVTRLSGQRKSDD